MSAALCETSGMRPRRCAMNSSQRHEEFSITSTRSMAMVGTSAMITRRSALAMDVSVPVRTNLMVSSVISCTTMLGRLCRGSSLALISPLRALKLSPDLLGASPL